MQGIADSSKGDDQLGINNEVTPLARLLANKKTKLPLSIGLFGDWGSGKSFFMNKLKDRIQEISEINRKENKDSKYWSKIAHIEFNAWHYVESNLWASLVYTLFKELTTEEEDQVLVRRKILGDKSHILLKRKEELDIEQKKFNIDYENKINGIKNSTLGIGEIFKGIFAENNADEKFSDEERKDYAKSAGLKEDDTDLFTKIYKKSKEHERLPLVSRIKRRVIGYSFLIVYFLLYLCFFIYLFSLVESVKNNFLDYINYIKGIFAIVPFIGYFPLIKWCNKNIFWSNLFLEKLSKAIPDLEEKILEKERSLLEKLNKLEKEKLEMEKENEKIQTEIKELEIEIKENTYERALSSFIKYRVESDDYQKHLGLPSIIRKDLSKLSELIKDPPAKSK